MDTRATRHKLLLDVGGTFIKCSDGRSIPVDSNGTREEIRASFKEAVGDLALVDKVAIAIPGPFNYDEGTFLMKHKYAAVYGEKFSDLVDAPAGVEFRFIHDVNCMLLGEVSAGAGFGYVNISLVALGTGLGFAESINGEIQKNQAGSPAVSIFNLPYKEERLEDFISKRGITRLYRDISGENTDGLSVKEIADRAHGGDANAVRAFLEAGHILGKVLAPILERDNIDCLLFGGQISRSFDLMQPALEEELAGVGCLRNISIISDFDNATFNGLASL